MPPQAGADAGRARANAAVASRLTAVMKPKPPVPKWRWAIWYSALGAALVLFYGLFTPFWFGLRVAAWTAEFRARRNRES
jgi:hypothetical protein